MRIVSALVAIALGSGLAGAQPREQMPAADVARWLAFFDTLVDTVVADQRDCDKMATDVANVIDQHRRAIAVAHAARTTKQLPVYAQQRMMDGVKKMAPGIHSCGSKDNVKAAFGKLETGT